MEKFTKIPIGIVNKEGNEKNVEARIKVSEIDYYYPGFYEGVVIVNKSGNSYLTTLSISQVDKMVNNHPKK